MPLSVWYLNHYAAPPGFGRGERPICLAREFTRRGHDITVISAAWHHLYMRDPAELPAGLPLSRDGTRFWLVPARRYRGNGIGRLLNMRDYARGVPELAGAALAGKLPFPDVVISSSPHPISFAAAEKVARRLNAKILFEERDIWPMSLAEASGISAWHPVMLWLGRHVRRAYRRSDAVVTLLPKAAEFLRTAGARSVHYIPNGASFDRWSELNSPLPDAAANVLAKLRAQGKLVVIYLGAHGKPNALDQLLQLAKVGAGERPYQFVLIGEGSEKQSLQASAMALGASYLTFLDPLPKAAVPAALAQADVGFISLAELPSFSLGVSPNKLFDYFLAGLPVIYAVNSSNRPVDEAQAGCSVPPYRPLELDQALRRMATLSAAERQAMGTRGREYALRHHDWRVLGQRYVDLCADLAGRSQRAAA